MRIKQCYPIVVAHRLTMHVIFVNLAAARVTSSAHLEFPICLSGSTAAGMFDEGRISNRRPAFIKRNRQPFVCGQRLPVAPGFLAHAT